MLDDDEVEEQWIRHLGPKKDFPREVAYSRRSGQGFRRVIAQDAEEYMTIIRNHVSDNNIYVGLYSERQRNDRVFDRVIFDIDSTDGSLKGSLRLMKLVVHHIKDKYDIKPTVYCTGGKGYHIILFFPEIDVSKAALRKWADGLANEAVYNSGFIKSQDDSGELASLILQQLDTSVFGDIMQVTRVPYTYNLVGQHRYRFCAPVYEGWSYERIDSELKDPERRVQHDISDEIARDIVKVDMSTDSSDSQFSFSGDSKGDEEYEEELLKLFNLAPNIKDGRRRIISFLIIPRLVAIGEDKGDVKRFCYDWLRKTGKPPHEYDRLIDHQYIRTIRGPTQDIDDDNYWKPWRFDRFFEVYSSIRMSIENVEYLLKGNK